MNYALRIRQSDECIDLLIKLKQFTHAANVAIGKGDTDALERIMEVAPVGERTEIAARMEQALNGGGGGGAQPKKSRWAAFTGRG